METTDKARRLFTFLLELSALRTRTIRTIDQYDRVLWLKDIPQEKGCDCAAWRIDEDSDRPDAWIEVSKPTLKAPPVVPTELAPWLDSEAVRDSSIEHPSIKERIVVERDTELVQQTADMPAIEFDDIGDHPEIREIWESWVEHHWQPWAEEDRRLQAVQRVYTDLFSLYQRQQRLGESYEVVLGLGLLAWKSTSGHEVRRHIITASTSITFDSARGIISLGPAGEGARPTLEQDMLDPQERPDASEQKLVEQRLAELGDDVWNGPQLQSLMQSWVHAVSAHGVFENTLFPQSEAGQHPRVHLAPAIIMRRRTERSLMRVYEEILEQLSEDTEVPIGIRRLVSIEDDQKDTDSEHAPDENSQVSQPEEVYFPLPSNEEQRQIIARLSSRQGVLVQGPPGTGKSQTIANLVCHLLATGHRVLVTSHTVRALRVLRDKFPPEIANLCVLLLGDGRDAMQALEDSVAEITDRYNTWNPTSNKREITRLEQRLDEARRGEADILGQLRSIRESETFRHPRRFGDYEGTAQQIALRLKQEEAKYAWIPDKPEEKGEPPLIDQEASELVRLFHEIDTQVEKELGMALIDPDNLPTAEQFEAIVEKEREAFRNYEEVASHRAHPAYAALKDCPDAQRTILIDALSELVREHASLKRQPRRWVSEAVNQVVGGREGAWRELYSATREHLEAISGRIREVSEREVTGLDGRDLGLVAADAQDLLEHLEQGKGLGLGPFRPKPVKKGMYIVKEVYVDGRLCQSVQPLQGLIEWIDTSQRLNSLARYWGVYIDLPGGPFVPQLAAYRDEMELLGEVLELLKKIDNLRAIASGIPDLPDPTWHDVDELEKLGKAAAAVALDNSLSEARREVSKLERPSRRITISAENHPQVEKLIESAKGRDLKGYSEALRELVSLKSQWEALKRRNTLLEHLRRSAPGLATEIADSKDALLWQEHMEAFTSAWNWARADNWLARLADPEEHDRLTAVLDDHRSRIRECLKELAAAKAWGHCFSRLTEEERQHLMAWTMAVRRIGRGTGKYASMHRQAARENMEQCRSAIPAWIMPIYRVAETIKPGKDAFDVVIVDEASQSGPEALFLQYIARQIVVVGDDKQISPEFIGINREDVDLLRRRYISDLPHNDALGVEHSFFDQAQIRYGGRIRLREHFRCMPEIIQFSNNEFYRSEPLIPLRQFGAGRLTPVVGTVHVFDGYVTGTTQRIVNPPEAAAIVQRIKECCSDPGYSGKSMGVISLQAESQARLIEQKLLEELGPEEMEKRNLICGDAYAFQGDERDIMFLSMVAAPTEGRRIGTLASQRDERRFNVAASRARDQMWLFHTATLNDLRPAGLRYKLLEYCQNPKVEQTVIEGLDVKDLAARSKSIARDFTPPPHPFDSWFEVDVFLKISEKGYRVLPQVEVNGRYLDLVVEGMRGRIAVECDGDQWHGPERYEDDMARQRMLERCGWIFWRVRGSTYYRDADAAMDSLWSLLDRLEIFPNQTSSQSQQEQQISLVETAVAADKYLDDTPVITPILEPVEAEPEPEILSDGQSVIEQAQLGLPLEIDIELEPLQIEDSIPETTAPSQNGTASSAVREVKEVRPQDNLILDEMNLIDEVVTIRAEVWFALAHWARLENALQPWERRLAFGIGRRIANETHPTIKQARQADRIYKEAVNLGFDPSKTYRQTDTTP